MKNQHGREQEQYSIQKWLLLLYLLFVVYGSLVPWRYVDRSLDSAVLAFKNIPFLSLGIDSRADWVANLLLFIPVTFLAHSLFAAGGGRSRRLLVGFLVFAAAVFLSVGIEFAQLFFPARTVSQNDIFAESLGALVGLASSWFLGARFQEWLHSFWRQQEQQDRVNKLLNAYLLLLIVFNLLPLDLTLSPVELFHKWREGRVMLHPFAMFGRDISQVIYEKGTDILVWVPAGLLWAMQAGRSFRSVILRGLIAAGGIEIAQLFVYSRFTDITDVLLAGVGSATGWLLAPPFGKALPGLSDSLRSNKATWWMGWAILTLTVFWFPFNFTLDRVSVSSATEAFTRLPFTTYYFTSEYHAINELLRKVGFFLPGGLLLGIAASGAKRGAHQTAWIKLAPLVLLAFALEAGQLLLPGKVADLTDALLESAGGVLGYLIALWIGVPMRALAEPVATKTLPAPNSPTRRQQSTRRPDVPWRSGYKSHLASVVGLSLAIGVLVKLPGVPYNLRELVTTGPAGMISALGLSLATYVMANGAFLLVAARRRRWLFAFPFWLVAQGLLVWFLLRVSVPMESLEDILGSPVLGWPWESEMLGRYLALHLGVMTQVLGAVLCVRLVLNLSTLADFIYWAVVSTALAWPLHLVIVDWAATDNLTELMAGNASFQASCALASALFLTCLAGSAVSATFHATKRTWPLLGLALVAMAGATLLYWLGAEQTIVKYGRVFSAFQFLLSTDREHYAAGDALMFRYAVTLGLTCGGLAALQWHSWRWICSTPTLVK